MAKPLKLFVLAGEPSGDGIGADLVGRLKSRVEVEISGVGGEALSQTGLKSEFDMNELSVMGWADVLPRLPKLLWRARQVARKIVRAIRRNRTRVRVGPDAYVLDWLHRLSPRLPGRALGFVLRRWLS